MTLGCKILLAMKEKKITQSELSKRTGLTPSALSNYVNDKREPKVSTLIKIAEGLETDVSEIIKERR